MKKKYGKYLKHDLKQNDRVNLFPVQLCKCCIVIKYNFGY